MSTVGEVTCAHDDGGDTVPPPIDWISPECPVLFDAAKQTNEPKTSSSKSNFSRICDALGMLPRAAESWTARFTKPLATLLCTLTAMVLAHGTLAVLFFAGFPWPTWRSIIPEAVFLACGCYLFLGIYFCGPSIVSVPFTRPVMLGCTPSIIYMSLSLFFGGMAFVPFSNRAIPAAGLSAAILGLDFVGAVLAHAQKEEDMSKLNVGKMLVMTVIACTRHMNNLTDYGFVRILIIQVQRRECFWFGSPSSCSRYVALAVLAGAFPTMTLLKETISSLGTQDEHRHQQQSLSGLMRSLEQERAAEYITVPCRRQRYLRPVVLLCQLGEVVITLLKIFSDAQTAAKLAADGVDKTTLQREIAFQFVSCGFSIATFIVSAIGFHKVMLAVKETAVRVSRRASHAPAVGRRRSSAVGGMSNHTSALNTAVHPEAAKTPQA